ncbi:uncharacterized protein METZ01_LOCUS342224, partial [marine metagenome]
MEMVIKCPACTTELSVDDAAAGSQIKCPDPNCGTLLVVPSFSPQSTASSSPVSTNYSSGSDEELACKIARMYDKMAKEVGKAIVGQQEVIEQLFIAVFARSHCLLEGV